MTDRPTGTVTFLFTDIEDSTRRWEKNPDAMQRAFTHQEQIIRDAAAAHNGYAYKMIGDAFQIAFATARDALDAAIDVQRALGRGDVSSPSAGGDPSPLEVRVRMALHTGVTEERGDDYVGPILNRVARLMSAGHGGQILISDATQSLVRENLPANVSLRDMGEHRLKDLTRAEHIYQVIAPDLISDFPPLKTLDNRPNNLPIQLTSFIGREREIEEIKRLLTTTRLLTLTGSGGCGKTRLATQVAAEMLDMYKDGVWFIEFAPLTDPALIPQTVVSILGLQPEGERPLMTVLTEFLHARTAFLILDNCEHMIADCAKFADTILHAAPNVKILASSREALSVAGEIAYRVPSLGVPDPKNLPPLESLTQYDAVRLFIDRAVAVSNSFAVTNANVPAVAQICARLDGIPLALELAAARVKGMKVEQIAQRLDDRFRLLTGGSRTAVPRQQTLRALIDWSYSLLSKQERALLRRLSVFVGGWTIEAAEAIVERDDISSQDVVDLLLHLVDKSLIVLDEQSDETRYRMLETIRQYARYKLIESDESENTHTRHLDFFLKFAEDAEPKLRGSEQLEWLDRLDIEHDNLRAAIAWSIQNDPEKGLQLVGTLWRFWWVRGYWREGREQLSNALMVPVSSLRTAERAKALNASGYFATAQADYKVARELFDEALSISVETAQGREEAFALNGLGNILRDLGDYSKAAEFYTMAIAKYHALDDQYGIGYTLVNLGLSSLNQGNLAEAQSHFESCLRISRELGNNREIGLILGNLGLLAYYRRDYESAQSLYEESLSIRRAHGDKMGVANQLDNLGYIALHRGNFGKARALFRESIDLSRELNRNSTMADVLYGLGRVHVQDHHAERGTRLMGAAEELLRNIGTPVTEANRKEYIQFTVAARDALDEATFNAAWHEGRAMSLEQAVAYALESE